MKVLLVYPFRADAYHKVGFVVPPMGLAYVGAALKGAGHKVVIRDQNVDRSPVGFGEFDLVGISMDTSRFKSGLALAREAKQGGAMVFAGGPHVSFRDDEALDSGVVDYVVRGEGEVTAVELARVLEDGGDPVAVEGLSFRREGRTVRTVDRPFIQDLDGLRPARELLPMDRYRTLEMGGRKISPVVTSRGCPFRCSFCCSSEFSGRAWRAMGPARVVDEMEEVITGYGYGGVAFLDDNFSMDPRRVSAICDEILRRGLDAYWWCFSRADILMRHEDMVRKMARAGCRYVFVGFESGRQDTLDGYGKGTKSEASADLVHMLDSHGISTHGSFIMGAVDETRPMVLGTIRHARRIDPRAVQFSILTPYPGTRLFEEVQDRITTRDWDLYDCLHPVIRLDHLGHDELRRLLKRAYASFYLSPGKLWAALMSGVRGKGIRLGSILKILRGTA